MIYRCSMSVVFRKTEIKATRNCEGSETLPHLQAKYAVTLEMFLFSIHDDDPVWIFKN